MESMEWGILIIAIIYIITTFPLWLITIVSCWYTLKPPKELTKEEWKMGGHL